MATPRRRGPPETATAKTFRLRLPRSTHLAGQHYIVRLTAEDGYTASRSYSVASPPTDAGDRADRRAAARRRGLHLPARRGGRSETNWKCGARSAAGSSARPTAPALLIGGGSGVVPLMAMLRLARQRGVPIWSGWWSRSASPRTSTTPTSSRARDHGHLHPPDAAGVRPPRRLACDIRPGLDRRRRHDLHLRLVTVRRRRFRPGGRGRGATGTHTHRTVRTDRLTRKELHERRTGPSIAHRRTARLQQLLADSGTAAQDDRSAERDPGDLSDGAARSPLRRATTRSRPASRTGWPRRTGRTRLAAGTYGLSIRSGEPIPDERLEADPAAELTVEEARRGRRLDPGRRGGRGGCPQPGAAREMWRKVGAGGSPAYEAGPLASVTVAVCDWPALSTQPIWTRSPGWWVIMAVLIVEAR